MADGAHYPLLFSPFRLAGLTLPNRVVMAAMETNMAGADGGVTPELIAYYRERAQGGVGLVTVEFTCVDRTEGLGAATQLSLDSVHLVAGHARLAQAIREAGARACLQLHHAGRQTSPRYIGGRQPVAPSAVDSPVFRTRPRPLAADEIERLVERFARAARWAVEAGYEAIELHGAHGYLLGQFLSPFTNRRDDAWGGDFERRLAFPCAVVRAVKAAIGPSVPLIYRLSAEEFVEGGLTIEDTVTIAPRLAAAGADALHVSTGIGERLDRNVDPISAPEGWRLPFARRIRAVAGVPVIAVGVIRRPEMAEAALAYGTADLVALGRALLADPEWAARARAGLGRTIRPCTSCNWCIDRLASHLAVGCAENPRAGRELDPPIPRAGRGERAAVVGAGPGGIVAALLLDQAGFRVTLFEARAEVGGGLVASARPPFKDKLLWYLDYLKDRLAESGVELRAGRPAAASDVLGLGPAFVVLATGGRARAVSIEGGDLPLVRQAYDVLMGDGAVGPGPVVVYGGGETGCETAEYAAARGLDVVLVTRSPARLLARGAELVYRGRLLERLRANPRIRVMGDTRIRRIGPDHVVLEDAEGREARLPAGQVLLARGREPGSDLEAALAGAGVPVAVVGDGRSVRRIGDAVADAYGAVRSFAERRTAARLAC